MSSNKQLSNEQHSVSSVQVSNEQSTDEQQNFIFDSLLPLIRDENSEHAELLDQLEVDMKLRMCHHQQRLAHSFSVGRLAQTMAQAYGVDVFHAGVAGILHDWAKVLSHEEQLALADSLKLDFGVPHQLVVPLLHGPIAARLLPKVYPWLSADTVQAIDRHTVGAHDMSDLDKIVFSADALDPLRGNIPNLVRIRERIGKVPLDDIFWDTFVEGIIYVLQTKRYLYPATLTLYNDLVQQHTKEFS